MFVAASALVAMITREPEADLLIRAVDEAVSPCTSPIAIYETVMAVSRKRHDRGQAHEVVEAFLQIANIEVVPVSVVHGRLALDAHARFGKGTGHPAQLNMGDCFAYAVAQSLGCSLLFKGDDFGRTDISPALRVG